MLLKFPDYLSIGIDENAAFVVADGQARTVSADGKAGCVIKKVVLSKNGPAVIERNPFTHSHGPVPLEHLLLSGRVGNE